MADRQIGISLKFTADTERAKKQLQDLQKNLQILSTTSIKNTPDLKITSDLQKASKAALQLKTQLQQATNVNTGNLDLIKFNQAMKKSGMELGDYQNQLYQLGPAGEKAFLDLSKSITLAEIPLKRTGKLVDGLWTSLKNTARWQISSSVLHGFMGSVQSAYSYAQNLNKSLNDIRIVTGQNTDQMAKFAQQANTAAKNLSTTTNAYTKAALIYYQQGDSDAQVLEKTDVTTKMANVTGQSAEVVSNQLTAIWNNFNKEGDQAAEHFADVLTALGAETASSTDEIAGGLEKFASVADTIGLSYEYAASALATITATTRQSEDVVGTALKTIFARIQGLKLGDTLEDGTSLNKYSEALKKVGISIFEQNGELKDMDSILAEMGNKWKNLSKDQQVALAQAVAGTRQYNQLVSLMDNWDFMEQNLQTAKNSTGVLNEQANIYAESWEAASNRVRASAEDIYDSLLNDEFFIDLNNSFAKLLDGVSSFIDGMGGMKGLLLSIGAIVTRIFNKQISESLSNAALSIKMLTSNGRKTYQDLKKEANDKIVEGAKDLGTTSSGYRAEVYEKLARSQIAYIENAQKMSEEELAINQMLMDRNQILADEVIKKGEIVEQTKKEVEENKKAILIEIDSAKGKNNDKDKKQAKNQLEETFNKQNSNLLTQNVLDDMLSSEVKNSDDIKNVLKKRFEDIEFTKEGLLKAFQLDAGDFKGINNSLENFVNALKDPNTKIDGLKTNFKNLANTINDKAKQSINDLSSALGSLGISDSTSLVNEFIDSLKRLNLNTEDAENILEGFTEVIDKHNKEMEEGSKKPLEFSQAITIAGSALMSIGQIISQIQGLLAILNDEEATTEEQITALISGLGMLVPAAMSIAPAFSSATVGAKIFGEESAKAGKIAGLAMWKFTLIMIGITAAIFAVVKAIQYFKANTPEGKLKSMQKASEGLVESLNSAKKASEDLANSFNRYTEAKNKLKDCQTGTKEWTEALKEANEAASQVIDNLPSNWSADQIKNSYHRNETTGFLELNEDIIKQAQIELDKKTTSAIYASQLGQISIEQSSNNVEAKKIADQIYNFSKKVVDRKPENIQTFSSDKIAEIIQEHIDLLTSSISIEDFKESLEGLGIDTSLLGKDLSELQNQVQDLGNSMEKASAQADLLAQSKVDQILGDQYDATVKNVVAKGLDKATENLEQKYLGALTNGAKGDKNFSNLYKGDFNKSNNGTEENFKKFLEEYNKLTGKNWTASSNAVQGADNNRVFEFFDEDGKIRTLRAEQIAAEMAAAAALEELTGNAKKASIQLSKLDGTEEGQDLKTFFTTGSFDHMTKDQLNNLIADKKGKITEDSTKEFLKKAYGVETDNDLNAIAEDLNMSLEDLVEQIMDGANYTITSFETIGNDLSETPRKIFGKIDTSNITAEGQKNITKNLQEIFNKNGVEGTKFFGKILNSMGDETNLFAESLDKIDWQNASPESIQNQLESLGITSNIISGKDLPKLISIMQKASEASLESAQTFYASLQKIKNSIKGNYSIIDQKAYEELKNAGIAVEAYFSELADGTYQLEMNAEEFKTLVNEISLEPLRNAFHQEIEKIETLENINESIDNKDDLAQATTDLNKQELQLQVLEASGKVDQAEMQELWTSYQSNTSGKNFIDENGDFILPTEDQIIVQNNTLGQEIADKMAEVNIGSENVSKIIEENLVNAGQEAAKIQKAINETEFRNDVEKYGLNLEETSEHAKRLAKELAGTNEVSEEQLKIARKSSIANQRLNRGVESVNKNLKDYKEILKDDNKNTLEYSKTMSDFKDSLADIFNVANGDMFSDTFAQAMLDSKDFEDALNGDEEALNRLRATATIDIGENIISQLDASGAEDKAAAASKAWNEIKSVLEDGFTMKEINKESFVNSLNDMIAASGMTKDQITSMLGSMGVDAEIKTEYKEMPTEVPTYTEVKEVIEDTPPVRDENGTIITPGTYKAKTYTIPEKPTPVTAYIPTYSIATSSGDTTSGGEINTTFTTIPSGTISPRSTTTSGGGGGKSKSKSKPIEKKSKVENRYTRINQQLADLTDALEDSNKQADRLFGASRLKQMEKSNNLIKKEVELLQKKRKEALNYQRMDQKELEAIGIANGAHFTFDDKGNVSNEEIERNRLIDEFNAIAKAADADSNISEEEQEKLDKLEERIKKIDQALNQYNETRELIKELDNEIQDKIYEWQDNNYEQLQYKLELQIDFEDAELQKLDYYLNKISDDFYKMAEAMSLMLDKIEPTQNKLERYKNNVEEADAQYANGEISQKAYIETLQNARDSLYDELEALNDLDKEMSHYYLDTLVASQDELDRYTSKLDHINSTFDHYLNLMELLGKQSDFKAMGNFLSGKAHNAENQMNIAEKNYNMLLQKQENYRVAMDASINDPAAYEFYKKQWLEIVDVVNEAQEDLFAKTKEWAEAMQAVIKNNLAKAEKDLENFMTDGKGFDRLSDEIDVIKKKEKEFLTDINATYEKNKLARQAITAAENTSNQIAQQKLKAFAEETKNLQKNGKLSNYELEVQKAKYDLLVAELALEDARNAKTTLRLMRNSSGDYDYVYTADQDKINDAQQKYDDAENRLYNLSLEAQNEYTEKYIQGLQEMHGKLADLNRQYFEEGTIDLDTYNQLKAQIFDDYLNEKDGILTNYQKIYNIAVRTDAQATEDAWGTNYEHMWKDTEEWKKNSTDYIGKVNTATKDWEKVSTTANEKVKGALDNSSEATDTLNQKSDELANEIEDVVIPSLGDQIDQVQALTDKYAAQRSELQALINEYERYVNALNEKIVNEAQKEGSGEPFNPDIDYSFLMAQAFNQGNVAAFEEAARNRNTKLHLSPGASTVSTADLQKLFSAAKGDIGSPAQQSQARALIQRIIDGNAFFTADAVSPIIAGLATGGYTGVWGPEGKLAVLHEKELVLNKEDTANLLNTINVLKDFGPDLFNNIKEFLNNNVMKNTLNPISLVKAFSQEMPSIEQSVVINADFPGVSAAIEIENALMSLANRAAQEASIRDY